MPFRLADWLSTPPRSAELARILAWPRLLAAFVAATFASGLMGLVWQSSRSSLYVRTLVIALVAVLVFGFIETRPRRLPHWLARWVLQLLGVIICVPVTAFVIYVVSTPLGDPPFWKSDLRLGGFAMLSFMGILLAPWISVSAIIRQRDAEIRNQALSFELERSQLERRALDARMRLLQAQVAPHFLFNTLANVRELVEAESPHAPAVLNSLIAYLRATVPRLDAAQATFDQELELVRAYLDLMHMRMPDRLRFSIQADARVRPMACPPMTLLTLVENAIRHGIDPSESGGDIDVQVQWEGGRCRASVRDTGVGWKEGGSTAGLGTGLAALRERLELAFAGDARLRLSDNAPRGAIATLDFPARPAQ